MPPFNGHEALGDWIDSEEKGLESYRADDCRRPRLAEDDEGHFFNPVQLDVAPAQLLDVGTSVGKAERYLASWLHAEVSQNVSRYACERRAGVDECFERTPFAV